MLDLLIAFVVGWVIYAVRNHLHPGALFRRITSLVKLPLIPGCLSELLILVVVIWALTRGWFVLPRSLVAEGLKLALLVPWEVAAAVIGLFVGMWWNKNKGHHFALLTNIKDKLLRR